MRAWIAPPAANLGMSTNDLGRGVANLPLQSVDLWTDVVNSQRFRRVSPQARDRPVRTDSPRAATHGA